MVSYKEYDLFSGMRPLEGVRDRGPARKRADLGHQHSHRLSADVSLAPVTLPACCISGGSWIDLLSRGRFVSVEVPSDVYTVWARSGTDHLH